MEEVVRRGRQARFSARGDGSPWAPRERAESEKEKEVYSLVGAGELGSVRGSTGVTVGPCGLL